MKLINLNNRIKYTFILKILNIIRTYMKSILNFSETRFRKYSQT